MIEPFHLPVAAVAISVMLSTAAFLYFKARINAGICIFDFIFYDKILNF